MTNHDAFVESVAAYAVGALSADERLALESHLAECPRCQAELRELHRVTAGLALAPDAEMPPPALRGKVLAYAAAHPQSTATQAADARQTARRPPAPAPTSFSRTGVLDRPRTKQPLPSWVNLALAASLGLAALAGLYAWALSSQVRSLREMVTATADEADRLRDDLLQSRQDTARLIQTVTVVTAPDMQRVTLKGQTDFAGATAQAFWSPTQGIVFNAEQLPALTPDRIYQLWVVQGNTVASAGIFDVRPNGSASLTVPLPANITRVDAMAVSLELAPGVPSRVGPVVLMGN